MYLTRTKYTNIFVYITALIIFIPVFGCSALPQRAASENIPQPALTTNPKQSPTPATTQSTKTVGDKGFSGVFAGLTVGVDDQPGVLTGFYSDGTGEDTKKGGPFFTCQFYVKGIFNGDYYQIKTWFPGDPISETINGTLKFMDDGSTKKIQIILEEEHGGCWNVIHMTGSEGAFLSEIERGKWSGVRIISSKKAYFYKTLNGARTNTFVVKSDPVRIMKDDGEWLQAEFAGKKTTQGWIKSSDLFPTDPK